MSLEGVVACKPSVPSTARAGCLGVPLMSVRAVAEPATSLSRELGDMADREQVLRGVFGSGVPRPPDNSMHLARP